METQDRSGASADEARGSGRRDLRRNGRALQSTGMNIGGNIAIAGKNPISQPSARIAARTKSWISPSRLLPQMIPTSLSTY